MKSIRNKKVSKYLAFKCIILLLLMSFMLSACHQSIADMDYPDEKLLARILDDYRDSLIEDGLIDKDSDAKCEIVRCYGIYNESVALILQCDALGYLDIIDNGGNEISGITFWGDWRSIEIWNNGEFYSLSEACDTELLRKEDIAKLAKDHNCLGKEYLAEQYTKFVSKQNLDTSDKEYTLKFYYGKYYKRYEVSNVIYPRVVEAVMFNEGESGEPHTETVAGVEFCYSDGNSIKIYEEYTSEFMSLQEAYDCEYIDEDILNAIAKIHNNEVEYPQS